MREKDHKLVALSEGRVTTKDSWGEMGSRRRFRHLQYRSQTYKQRVISSGNVFEATSVAENKLMLPGQQTVVRPMKFLTPLKPRI